MENRDQACQTPWEDLRRGALEEYERASAVAHSWASVIPEAINYYFDHARAQSIFPEPIPTEPANTSKVIVKGEKSESVNEETNV